MIRYFSVLAVLFAVFHVTFFHANISRAQTEKQLTAKDWLKQGILMGKKGNFDQAIECFNRSLEINPRLDKAYQNRGIAWSKKGNFKRAIADFNMALEINPRNTAVSHYKRIALEDQKKEAPAVKPNEELNFEDWFEQGVAFHQKNDFQNAITALSVAIDIAPLSAKAYRERGVVWDKKGDYKQAIND